MFDSELAEIYRRKYYDRSVDHIRTAVKQSIEQVLGKCEIVEDLSNKTLRITNIANSPKAKCEIWLTPQRITYSYYRIEEFVFLLPLDMKRDQNPAPRGWVFSRDMNPRTFKHYVEEYDRMLNEATRVL